MLVDSRQFIEPATFFFVACSSFLNLSGRIAFGMRFKEMMMMMMSGILACRIEKGKGKELRNNVKKDRP